MPCSSPAPRLAASAHRLPTSMSSCAATAVSKSRSVSTASNRRLFASQLGAASLPLLNLSARPPVEVSGSLTEPSSRWQGVRCGTWTKRRRRSGWRCRRRQPPSRVGVDLGRGITS
ncbi:hypothetical protein PIB30_052012 [Stylosanthes scabra]|uniref:Uncharacterized protein n=1 Tax=Stylosanthes scabra TaxID=79078 RepID=A0ABU6XFT0_9FABA|nr:hypothetical protein [Stylosanthes scabra]